LSWHIYCWYERRYGEKLRCDRSLGRVAFSLRGDVWFMKIPLIYGSPELDVLNLIDDLTVGLRAALTVNEKEGIWRVFHLAYEALTYLTMKGSKK